MSDTGRMYDCLSISGDTVLSTEEKTVAFFCVFPSYISRLHSSVRRAFSL